MQRIKKKIEISSNVKNKRTLSLVELSYLADLESISPNMDKKYFSLTEHVNTVTDRIRMPLK